MPVRGRKNKQFSLICKHFIQKDQKPLSPAKFADDKCRAFANSILEMDLEFLPFELKNILMTLKSEKLKFNKKAVMIIEEVSLFPGAWLLIKQEFFKLSSWMSRLELKLKISLKETGDEKDRIYLELVRLIFEYLEKKGENSKKKKEKVADSTSSNALDDSESEKNSDTCSTANSAPLMDEHMNDLFEPSSTLIFSEYENSESFKCDFRSGDELDLDNLSLLEDFRDRKKTTEG